MPYIKREIEKLLLQTLKTRPLVYLNGPRQVGKSTLAEHIPSNKEINYITLDSPLLLASVKSDPTAFISSLPKNKLNIIDEIQLAPEIFRELKAAIDNSRKNADNTELYLLTGSANIFALHSLAEALVGRMAVLTLLPFSAAEYKNSTVNFIKRLWDDELSYTKYQKTQILDIIPNATYPEIALNPQINRAQWFDDYLNTIIKRDIKTIADIRNPDKIIQLLAALSQRAGTLLNDSSVMKDTGLDAKTYNKYKSLITNTFLIHEVQSWSKSNQPNKRFVKQTKLYFTDTNLLCHITRRDIASIYQNDPITMGRIFENFIASEILKNIKSLPDIQLSHFNLYGGKEVDFVLENSNGDMIGLEVKLSSSLSQNDFNNMKILADIGKERFKKGVVLYTGCEVASFGANLWAVPINYLWE